MSHSHDAAPLGASEEELFERHLALADRLARRYSFGSGLDEDLRQVARMGLLFACRRFDPERGAFVRFAVVTINGELKKHLRSHGWGVRVPRALQEDSITVAAASERLTSRLGRSPSVGEVADETGFEGERVVEAIRAREARFTTSVEHQGIDAADPVNSMDAALLSHAMSNLDDDERALIEYRFRDGLTQSEIGRLIGISQPQVHRRLSAAIENLRAELEVCEEMP
ncbi:sigma-70 family RNA polymerase sigma factor [Ilumatobacter nonamiensis]|uniref:sigma-70 family RNA polymerase sigma factor n=1 Tax=Ilumatobacter nonamiensis TaxID=467093 RepID=UPI00130E5A05|nr:sigma-70 family RNA polymerase sigma factor [Ilumatobacter nonamiensis]